MDAKFIRDRISFLRTKKGISEYKMSLDLGHSKGYIQSISSGKSFPSVPELLYICEYLEITPKEFFDTETTNPTKSQELMEASKGLSNEKLDNLIALAKNLK